MSGVCRTTWWTLEANVIVGASATMRLFFVNAPEALIQTGVDHLPCVGRCHPVCGASLHGDGPRTNPLPVVETDGLQSLVVSVASRVVDVEPRCPLRHTLGEIIWESTIEKNVTNESNSKDGFKNGEEETGKHTRLFNTVGQLQVWIVSAWLDLTEL